MAFSNHGVWFKSFLAKYICINDPSNISARVTEYPPLKLSDIQEYYLSDIPQFLKSTSTAISFRFKINSRWERVSGCCRRREIFFCSLSRTWGYPKENKRKHPEVSRENLYGYRELFDDIICSKVETIFVSEAPGKLLAE